MKIFDFIFKGLNDKITDLQEQITSVKSAFYHLEIKMGGSNTARSRQYTPATYNTEDWRG